MPNFGKADYSGNWAATVQDMNGDINLRSGPASVAAEFEDGDITATLDGLATLTGDISGNTFSGDAAEVPADNGFNLTAGDDYTGTFSGGFYGTKAAEAGGVFDFASDDDDGGAFRGAFGGQK